ncbi:hypothetical protein [Aliikangiella coralliicola]|uniref:Uncharacterized protein n=1 Tax=Aliikangiella coralliicola TaxID=2592383 RepID=A0A545U016_9GAMM|nr:hypothetical protein [Aliikangiella coralliicola]TQV82807.1 hypothetical protein FLL46_23855 [Aliikangiella coralliicola]
MKLVSIKIYIVMAIGLGVLGGCSSTPKIAEISIVTDQAITPEVLSTEKYLPFIQVNEETGKRLPYASKQNPYLKEKGQLDKNIVVQFIEARRAIKLKKFVQAEKILLSISEQNTQLSGPVVLLGDIAKLKQQTKAAIKYYAQAISVNSNNVNAYIKLAKMQRESGLFKHAQNTYAKALSKWSDFPEAHLNLSILYDVYLNQPEIAQKHMEAYQLLAKQKHAKVDSWLKDIRQRTNQANYIEQDAQQKEQVILARLAAEQAENSQDKKGDS